MTTTSDTVPYVLNDLPAAFKAQLAARQAQAQLRLIAEQLRQAPSRLNDEDRTMTTAAPKTPPAPPPAPAPVIGMRVNGAAPAPAPKRAAAPPPPPKTAAPALKQYTGGDFDESFDEEYLSSIDPDDYGMDDGWDSGVGSGFDDVYKYDAPPQTEGISSIDPDDYGMDDGWDSGVGSGFDDVYKYDAPPQTEGIIAPLGDDPTGRRRGRLCGQPEWVFDDADPAVPVGSHYEPWVWEAIEEGRSNHVTVELYINASDPDEVKLEVYTNAKGEEKTRQVTHRAAPPVSFDHHVLACLPAVRQAPWGDARRVLLVPMTHKKATYQVGSGERKRTVTYSQPDISGARAFLSDPERSAQVVHGWCSMSFKDDSGKEHYSDYWVILPKADLERKEMQQQFEETRLRGQSVRNAGEETFLTQRASQQLSTRFLGCWLNESAKYCYEAAQAHQGAIMPDSCSQEQVRDMYHQHLGRQALNHQAQAQRQSEAYIPAPLAAPTI